MQGKAEDFDKVIVLTVFTVLIVLSVLSVLTVLSVLSVLFFAAQCTALNVTVCV